MQQSEEERQLQEAIALSLQQQQQQQQQQQSAPTFDTARSAMSEDSELRMALELSMEGQQGAAAGAPPPLDPEGDGIARLDAATVQEADAGGPALSRVIFGDAPAPEVVRQWRMQGFTLADVDVSDAPGVTPFGAGLAQINGGPCAVLAAAQAFMLRRLLFSGDEPSGPPTPQPTWLEEAVAGDGSLLPSETEASEALLRGLADALVACATTPSAAVATGAVGGAVLPHAACQVVLAVPMAAMLDDMMSAPSPELVGALVAHAARPTTWQATLEELRARRQGLASPLGALAVLVSALLTRGVGRFSAERDDASQPLLDPQFGHCSQEVLNLLLLGVGVSNVFDGARDLGGGFMLRGVPHRPPVGLLSELEALRYLQVGSFCKQPVHPIWVVASESHYSILFALTGQVQAVDARAALEERLLAAFSEFDQEGNGFVSGEHLGTLVAALPQWQTPPVEELRGQLDPEGTSLVLWDNFQRIMMPLHPEAAALPAEAAAPTAPLELYHYNGLGAKGHENKRALRKVQVEPGKRPVGPAPQGLAAIIDTRWKDALVTHEGPPPSIN